MRRDEEKQKQHGREGNRRSSTKKKGRKDMRLSQPLRHSLAGSLDDGRHGIARHLREGSEGRLKGLSRMCKAR